MKKKIVLSLALLAALCFALFLFAACDETKKEISASLSKTEAIVGEEITLTYSTPDDTPVTVSYSKDGGASVAQEGTSFTAQEHGVYVFTFSAEGYESVECTLTVKTEQDALFAGGTGVQNDPYRIANAQQLKNIGQMKNELLAAEQEYWFELTADIDLSAEQPSGSADYGTYFVEVFSGKLNGAGHTVKGSNTIDHLFHYAYQNAQFEDFTLELADRSITRVAAIGAYAAKSDLGKGVYEPQDENGINLWYTGVNYKGQEGASYFLGDNNAALYYDENCTVVYAWYEGAMHATFCDNSGAEFGFEMILNGCSVTGDFTGGGGNSGAAIFLAGQIGEYTSVTFRDCSFNGTITGKNVGVLFANYAWTGDDPYFRHVTVVGSLTVQGKINALGGKSGVTFANNTAEHKNISEEAKACINNVAADETLALAGTENGTYTVTAATNANVAYYEIRLALATVYWYADDTYTEPWLAQTNSNNVTIRVEKDALAQTGVYKAQAVTLGDALEKGIVDDTFVADKQCKEGFRYGFVVKDGTAYLVMDYEATGNYFKFAATSYVKASVFAFDAAGTPLAYADENK